MEDSIEVTGIVMNVVYYLKENGYTVFEVEDTNKNKIVCVGNIQEIFEGESIKITGNYTVHPSYGKQIKVTYLEKIIPTSMEGIEKYLASGIFKGIRDRIAKKIIKKFGDSTLIVIEKFPEELATIKGITPKKAMEISATYHEQVELRSALIFLSGYGISVIQGAKIYEKFKQDTYNIIKNNPYKLVDEVYGIGFKLADRIAFKAGIGVNSTFRIKSGVKYTLGLCLTNGHVYMPKELLLKECKELLNIEILEIENILIELQIERVLILEDTTDVYLNYMYYAENFIAKKIIELSNNDTPIDYNLEEKIEKIENNIGIKLANQQKESVIEALKKGAIVITGGPGTGKTTIIKTIINLLENEGYTIQLTAPTGRAAKRMSEATGREAKTIHRLLEISYNGEGNKQFFLRNAENPIDANVIIVDEISMVDEMLMFNLLKGIDNYTKLILVGDADQLPSVGAGNVLGDIIKSGCIKVVKLTEIFRQAKESAIVINAHRINKGKYPVFNQKNKDFYFVKCEDINSISNKIIELVTMRLPNYIKNINLNEIQILTPMRRTKIGVEELNRKLQENVNPPIKNKVEKIFKGGIFREGDKVMQIKNNYNISWSIIENNVKREEGAGVYNGDTGVIAKIKEEQEKIWVIFDDNKLVIYDYTQLDELELAYAITIHKSQGSEYRVVVIPVHNGYDMLMTRNLLYTGVTRAKELVVLVGKLTTIYRMVDNDKEIKRYSKLANRIIKMGNLYKDNLESDY